VATRQLDKQEKRTLAALGLPTFALALSITVVSTYLPVVAREFTSSSTVIGLLIGGEGVMALFLPLLVGVWSDRLRTHMLGGRLPFLLGAMPVVAASLVAMGLVNSMLGLAVSVGIFFAAYFVAYEPYRALYPDLLDDEIAARGQATQAIWRGAGTALALAGGGLLLSVARVLPFATAAALSLVCSGLFLWYALRLGVPEREPQSPELREVVRRLTKLLRERRQVRALLVANSLWELSLAALKTFVVLYITRGLGYDVSTASLIIGGTSLIILVAAGASGRLGDRYGKRRIMGVALVVYAVGLLVPFLVTSPALIVPALPLIAFGGGVVMSLPYALLIPMMPPQGHGALTGLYSMSRGVGVVLGPILGGAAIDALKDDLSSTQGYSAVWLVCAAAVALSIPLLRLTRGGEDERRAEG
jgi:MFS family permease